MARERVEIRPFAPFDFEQALDYVRASPSAVLEQIGADGIYRRALTLGGHDVLLTAQSVGTVAEPRLLLDVEGATVEPGIVAEAVRALDHTFSLQLDPAFREALAARDPVLGRILEQFAGLRPLLLPDPYEALLWAVVGQQVHTGFARKLKAALIALVGRRLTIGDQTYPMLPRPKEVAGLSVDALRAQQFSRQKAAYVIGLSQAIVEGRLDFAALRALPPEQAITALMEFPGVGRWTAESVLLRGLGVSSVIPAADIALRGVIGRAYGLGRTATEAEVRALAKAWGEWRGWATIYWWLASRSKSLTANVATDAPL